MMNDKINKLLSTMSQFNTELDDLKESLSTEESTLSKELNDLYHYIEFGKFDAANGYKACKMMQDCLRKRRDVKNSISIVSSIKDRKILTPPIAAINEIIEKCYDEKTYTPRVRDDLFVESQVIDSSTAAKIAEKQSHSISSANYYCDIYDLKTNKILYTSCSDNESYNWLMKQKLPGNGNYMKSHTVERYLQRMRQKINNNKPCTHQYLGYRFEWNRPKSGPKEVKEV